MLSDRNPHWVYTQTIKMFAAPASPPFEDEAELERHWGRVRGIDNDVGQIRSILVHRPGPEMAVVDPAKRIPEIGSFGDVEQGWYFQSETPPDVPAMQTEHDELVAALKAAGVEVFHAEGVDGGRLKSCYTRDPLVMVKGGAIVCRMGARIRRGEELATTRTLAKIGVPILRTISGAGVMEGGSFAWINSSTAAIGVGVRVNRDGVSRQPSAYCGERTERPEAARSRAVRMVGSWFHLNPGVGVNPFRPSITGEAPAVPGCETRYSPERGKASLSRDAALSCPLRSLF
jgi:hypothetical protein